VRIAFTHGVKQSITAMDTEGQRKTLATELKHTGHLCPRADI